MKKINKMVIIFLLITSLPCLLFGQVKEFSYDSKKMMDVGTMYTYSVKEIGGEKEMDFYFYIKDELNIAAFCDYSKAWTQVVIVDAELDPRTCSFKREYSKNPFSYMKIYGTDYTEIIYDFDHKRGVLNTAQFNNNGTLKQYSIKKDINIFPVYEQSMFSLDLWLAFRNYQGDYSDFTVSALNNISVDTEILHYEGKEVINGVKCDKWVMTQKGILAKMKGNKKTIWIDNNDDFKKVIKYTDTKDLFPIGKREVTFVKREAMTLEGWQSFVEKKQEAARIRLNFPKNN